MFKIILSAFWVCSWALLHYKLVPASLLGGKHAALLRAIEPFFGGYLGGFAACAALILSFYVYTIGLEADR